ncbi:MAG: protein kinase [Thermoleophilaceae bacterium]|nr:protein kinase [Thermoleophilaceae bacterium]
MAVVLLAEDQTLGREVAVKRLHTDSPEDTARRFAREARLGASLNHPNVVTIYDTVTDDEGVLIVMEFVDGATLADALRSGRMPTKRALSIVRDIATGLDHVHQAGVVHRDVKPANVMIPFGTDEAKLTDLGIATISDGTRITRTGTVLGTPAYMAPEQLAGETTGAAVDTYALSAIAFEALSGQKARAGRSAIEIAHKVANDAPPDLRDEWPEAPSGAAAVLKRGMARDPAARPASATELSRELDAVFEERTEPTRVATSPPTEATRRIDHTPSRSRAPLAMAAVLVAALAIAAVALLAGGGGGEKESASSDGTSSTEEPTRSQTEEQLPEARAPAPATEKVSAAEAQKLQQEARALNQQGKFEQAIPKLEQARDALKGSDDPFYYFTLYELGVALNGAGRSEEAIPVLEERLQYDSQREVVQKELDKARAGGDSGGDGSGNGKAKGKKKDD